jgi:hypothetical protein
MGSWKLLVRRDHESPGYPGDSPLWMTMPIERLLKGSKLGAEDVEILNRALDAALRTLNLVDRGDPVTEIVARKSAVLDSKIADQRDHEAARHGIDELDRIPIAY